VLAASSVTTPFSLEYPMVAPFGVVRDSFFGNTCTVASRTLGSTSVHVFTTHATALGTLRMPGDEPVRKTLTFPFWLGLVSEHEGAKLSCASMLLPKNCPFRPHILMLSKPETGYLPIGHARPGLLRTGDRLPEWLFSLRMCIRYESTVHGSSRASDISRFGPLTDALTVPPHPRSILTQTGPQANCLFARMNNGMQGKDMVAVRSRQPWRNIHTDHGTEAVLPTHQLTTFQSDSLACELIMNRLDHWTSCS
jgi:hypothetical protein